MSINHGTLKSIKNIIQQSADVVDITELEEYLVYVRSTLQTKVQAIKNRPVRSASGNMRAPVSTGQQKAVDFLGDWLGDGPKAPVKDENIYTEDLPFGAGPAKEEYVDNDFENAKRNREHIDNVMKGIMR